MKKLRYIVELNNKADPSSFRLVVTTLNIPNAIAKRKVLGCAPFILQLGVDKGVGNYGKGPALLQNL